MSWRQHGEAPLWIAGLLLIVSLSVADGLLANVVAFERDTTVFYFPLMAWVSQRLHQGELPLWSPQMFGGYPIFADGEIGLAYPPVLLALLLLPPDRAFVFLRLLHLALAALGTLALARAWRLPYASAVLAGVVVALGNFLQAQIHHENIIRTASWLPLTLALVEYALRVRTWRARLRWTALAAIALGLAGLSLHSQMLAIDLLILGTYGLFRWLVGPLPALQRGSAWAGRLVSVAVVCGPVVVFGMALAAVQLVPLIELAGFSARGSGLPYADSAAYSLTPYGLVQAIFPFVFRGQGNLQWGLWTHWESYLYVGLAPLVLATIGLVCVRRREVFGWGVIGGLGLVLALGQYSPINLHYWLWLLPGLSGLRAPGRFTLVVVLASGMLAAYGLAWLQSLRPTEPTPGLRRLLAGLSAATFGLWAALIGAHAALLAWPTGARDLIGRGYLSLPRDTYALTASDVYAGALWSTDVSNPRVFGALGGLSIILIGLWLWRYARSAAVRGWRGWPALFVGISALDLLIFGWGIHPREPLAVLAAEPPAVQAIEQAPSPDAAPNRLLASSVLNQVAADRLAPISTVQEASGYSSLQFIWHRDYLSRVQYVDDGLLDLWNVRYVLDPASYGPLSSYRGVNFLTSQALLHSPAGGALSEQRFSIQPGSSTVELRFVSALMGGVGVRQGARVAEIELRNEADEVVATAQLLAGRDVMEWAWDLPNVQPYVQHERVESAGLAFEGGSPPNERLLSFGDVKLASPVSATSLIVRAVPPAGELVLFGGAAIGSDNSEQQFFGHTKAKFRQVFVDPEIRVLENTSAMPRAFVVPRARVAPSLGTALNEMTHQPFEPTQEVILADDTTTRQTGLSTDRGGEGTARVTSYADASQTIHTSTSGDAWLVVSDTYYPGWTATVDGQPATVLRGDVLFRVVPIPGGEHDVELRFEPPSLRIGGLISLVALSIVLVTLVLAGGLAARGRTTSA